MSETRGVYTLSPAHAAAISKLAGDPEITAILGIAEPLTDRAASDFVAAQVRARDEGRSYTFVITDRGELLGVCGLSHVAEEDAFRLIVGIDRRHRRHGNATFAGERMLDLAFQNLQLNRVVARAHDTDAACRRLLERLGFESTAAESHASTPQQVAYQVTRHQWQDARARPAIAAIHPSLRQILEAELAAGNEVAELRSGWPDANSVFVRLRHSFRTHPGSVPAGVVYSEPNDPHWWKAEYVSSSPRHILAS